MRVCNIVLIMFLVLSSAAQEPQAQRVIIPLIANTSHHTSSAVTIESLVITDQKKPVAGATLLRGADLPLELGILIDASNSQRGANIAGILSAANKLVEAAIRGPEDRVFFLQFDAQPHATGWMNKEQLQNSNFKVTIGGGTALYDAVLMASKDRMGRRDWGKPTRRVFVLITDGEDNLSHVTRDEAASAALAAGAVIFTVNTAHEDQVYSGEKVLEYLAKLTGGESFSRLGAPEMPKVLANILELMSGMYYVSYVPPPSGKGDLHEVEVKPAAKEELELSYARKYRWNP